MVRKPLYTFDSDSSLGIEDVPLNGLVFVENSGGTSRSFVVTNKTNITPGVTTITNFLATTADWQVPNDPADYNHDDLTGYVANEHIDWTADQGATNIHTGNYTNTEYTAFTNLAAGLAPASGSVDTSKYLVGNGTWIDLPVLSGTVSGIVTTQGSGTTSQYLNGAGAWSSLPVLSGTVSGIVTTNASADTTKFLNAAGAWSVPDGVTLFSALTDTDINTTNTLATGDLLQWNGTDWLNVDTLSGGTY